MNQPTTSTITWSPADVDTSNPSALTGTIVNAALVCPGPSVLSTDATGRSAPAAYTEKYPAPAESSVVRFTARAIAPLASAGSGTRIAVSGVGRPPVRVSSNRTGGNGSNRPEEASSVALKEPATSTIRSLD